MKTKEIDLIFAEIYIKKYRDTLCDLKRNRLYVQEYPEGRIINKTIYKKTKSKTYSYKCKILQTKESVHGKSKTIQKYIHKNMADKIKQQIAERDRYEQIIKMLEVEVEIWKKKLMAFAEQGIVDFNNLTYEADLILEAEKHHYNSLMKNFDNKAYGIVAENGCLVRSKGEAIFANMAKNKDIIFFYEKELVLKSRTPGGTHLIICPDFTIYINGGILYVELLGIMEDSFYKENWSRRLNEYNINGIERGKNLICFSCGNGKEFNCDLLSYTLDSIKKGYIPYDVINLDKPKMRNEIIVNKRGIYPD